MGDDSFGFCQDRLHGSDAFRGVKKTEVDSGKRAGVPTDMAEKLKALKRENRELRQANEIFSQGVSIFCPGGA